MSQNMSLKCRIDMCYTMYSDKCNKRQGRSRRAALFSFRKKGVFFLNTVEPIRDMDLVLDVADYLKAQNERDYVLFMFGIYTGLRISDILKFRVRDVKDKQGKKDFEYLFKSPNFPNKAISRQQAYNILSKAGGVFGISSIGTHTLRKTFGYHMYQQTHDAVTIKEILNHSDISVTLRYIGINQDNKDKAIKGLTFKKKGHR